jgi:hypothetical protein
MVPGSLRDQALEYEVVGCPAAQLHEAAALTAQGCQAS